MSRPNHKPPKGKSHSSNKKAPVYSSVAKKLTLFEKINNSLTAHSRRILTIILCLFVLVALLLFQARMDVGGDDSAYILRAYNFVHKGIFPDYQGPFYPLFLSILIVLSGGVRVVLFKFTSVVFVFFSLFFLYKAFKNRVPALVLYSVLLLTAINVYIARFASLTYSEASFMFLQSLMLFYFFRLYDKLNTLEKLSLKETYQAFLVASLFVLLLSLSRSVGLFAFPALLLFFLVRRKFKHALYFIGFFAAWEVLIDLMKKAIWHVASQWGAERSVLMLKDQYNPAAGYENLSGFIARFKGNCNLYLSKRFFQVIGLRSPDSTEVYGVLTVFFVALCLFTLYRAVKSKNNYVLLITLYCLVMLVCTFLAVQTSIDQPRFVMVYVPLLLIMFIYAIYDALKKSSWTGQSMLVYIILILTIAGLVRVLQRSKANLPVIDKNLHGDISYGYTPDWVNYIKMAKWCASNLPQNSKVAIRKGEICFIYTNKEMFFSVFKPYSENPDTVLAYLKRNRIDYVALASLRINPHVDNGVIINTLWRMMAPVAKKYPSKLKLVHQQGTGEPTYLYKVIQ